MANDQALVLAGHGSHHDSRAARPLFDHADRIRRRGWFDVVRAAFWKEQPSLAEVLGTIDTASVFVVPVTTSEGYFSDGVFPRELGSSDEAAVRDSRVQYTAPVGTHALVGDVIVERVRSVLEGAVDDAEVSVALVGHGTPRHDRSATSTRAHAARLRRLDRFAAVEAVFLDQSPRVHRVTDRFDGDVVVVPLFVANGLHVRRDLPRALGLQHGDEPFGGPVALGGSRLWYTEAVGTSPRLEAVVLDRALEAGAVGRDGRPRRSLTTGASAAFLRWMQPRDEQGRPPADRTEDWGQLTLTSTATQGVRYDLRHRADREVPTGDLERLETPTAVRSRTRFDDDGAYRPLRTTRTLPRGWCFETTDPEGFVESVRAVYPASIDHWYRQRRGTLATTPFAATVGRQSGRYGTLDRLDRPTLAATIDACCGDCVRRRAWEADGVARATADGSFPCPEACSFLLEAARSFATEDGGFEGATGSDDSMPAAAFDRPDNRTRLRFTRARTSTGGPRPEEVTDAS